MKKTKVEELQIGKVYKTLENGDVFLFLGYTTFESKDESCFIKVQRPPNRLFQNKEALTKWLKRPTTLISVFMDNQRVALLFYKDSLVLDV